uniref:S100P-binding protein n=1 Tax=Euleptes europaea TaxID=460621 RepID=UPI0025407101|nr:S100P-binding protein [Euleptes europaea]
MSSRYFHCCRSGLYHELKVTVLNDLVSRSKRPLEDFQEGERALQSDVKKQRCGSPFPSQKTSLASAVPSSPSNGIAGSQVYSMVPDGESDDSELDVTLLECSDGEFPDSPFSGTLEDEDRLLAEDPETDTSDVSSGFSGKEVGGAFAAVSFVVTQLQSVSRAPGASLEPLPPTGLSVHPSGVLANSSAPVNPERGINASVDSQNQMGLNLSPDRLGLQAAMSIEAGSFSIREGDSGSGVVDKGAAQTVGEEAPVVSPLMAKREFASVVTDRPSEGQAFVEQSEVGGESASNPPCEGASNSATEVPPEHFTTVQNEDHAEDPSPEEPEDPYPDDSRRRRISIPEDRLQWSKEKYVADVVAHAHHASIIGAVNELQELMREVASECLSRDCNYRHPTDLTVRNYAQRRNRKVKKCSLEKWRDRNQRHYRRFAGIPDKFERSPIPSR